MIVTFPLERNPKMRQRKSMPGRESEKLMMGLGHLLNSSPPTSVDDCAVTRPASNTAFERERFVLHPPVSRAMQSTLLYVRPAEHRFPLIFLLVRRLDGPGNSNLDIY